MAVGCEIAVNVNGPALGRPSRLRGLTDCGLRPVEDKLLDYL